MIDSIDREELLNNRPEYLNPRMEDEIQSAKHKGWNECNSYYYNLITKQPKVDTVRHAHWIKEKVKYPWYRRIYPWQRLFCSNCKTHSPLGLEHNYCPNCGCKMDEVTSSDS